MKTLSKRNQELISRGLRACGKNMDAYYYIEDELYCNQANKIFKFFQWLFKINRPYGPVNAQERWAEFVRGDQPPAEYFDLEYGYNYDVKCTNGTFNQDAIFSERMKEPTLNRIARYMMNKNWDLNYWFKIVNQEGDTVAEFTKAQVLNEVKKLKNAGVKETGEMFKFKNGYI